MEGAYGAQQPFCPLEWLGLSVHWISLPLPEVPERGTMGFAWPFGSQRQYPDIMNALVTELWELLDNSDLSFLDVSKGEIVADRFACKRLVNSLMALARFWYSKAVMLVEWDNRKYHIKLNTQRFLCTDWKPSIVFVFTVLYTGTVKQYLLSHLHCNTS